MNEFFDIGDHVGRQRNARIRGYALVVAALLGGTVIVFILGMASLHA